MFAPDIANLCTTDIQFDICSQLSVAHFGHSTFRMRFQKTNYSYYNYKITASKRNNDCHDKTLIFGCVDGDTISHSLSKKEGYNVPLGTSAGYKCALKSHKKYSKAVLCSINYKLS